jgi:hypothetical protein
VPILNYTTEVTVEKSVAAVSALLSRKGAQRISTDYDDYGNPTGVEFTIKVFESSVNFRLPCKVDGVLAALKKWENKVPPRYQNREQARRVAWRIIKDWVEAQLALIEAGQAELAEVFLPYAIDSTDRTFFQAFSESKQKLLTVGSDNESVRDVEAAHV